MRANGMKVVTAVKYDNLFLMADGKRFDGFRAAYTRTLGGN